MTEALSYIHPTAELSPGLYIRGEVQQLIEPCLFFLIQIVALARQEAA
jgi:hypothetical protein